MSATAAISELFVNFKMADIENWLTSGMSCCTNTKDQKEIKRKKVEAILEHGSGDFLVGFIAYRGHFLLVCFKYQRVFFRAPVGEKKKKNHILFLRKVYQFALLPINCRSISKMGLV